MKNFKLLRIPHGGKAPAHPNGKDLQGCFWMIPPADHSGNGSGSK
jgi:hypothetical protein